MGKKGGKYNVIGLITINHCVTDVRLEELPQSITDQKIGRWLDQPIDSF